MAIYLYMHIHNMYMYKFSTQLQFSYVQFSLFHSKQWNRTRLIVHEQDYCINNYADHTNSVT